MSVLIRVSVGEALDKLSILQIKAARIRNEAKLAHIHREINELMPVLGEYMKKVQEQYELLYQVNERIWNMCDDARTRGTTDPIVMKENDARFRVKKKINQLVESHLLEQKDFGELHAIYYKREELWADAEKWGCSTMEEAVRRASTYNDTVLFYGNKWPAEWIRTFADDPAIRVVFCDSGVVEGV